MDIHEVTPDEIDDYITLRNEIFTGGPVPVEWWRSLYDAEPRSMTGLIAVENGETLGSVSYLLKDLQAAPGRALKAAFANAVGVAEKARSGGLGSRLHKAALEILPSYSDALMVIIHEGQKAYPFYRRNGYVLLHAPDTVSWPLDDFDHSLPDGIQVGEGWDLYRENESALLHLFRHTFASCGGFYVHEPGWIESLRGHHDSDDDTLYRDRLRTVLLVRDGAPAAYALLKLAGKPGKPAQVNEFAARNRDPALASEVLRAASVVALDAEADSVRAYAGPEHPLDEALQAFPLTRTRGIGLFGQPMDAQKTAHSAYGDLLADAGVTLGLGFRSSDREGSVVVGSGPAHVKLAMEYEEWVRAIFRRTSLVAGVTGGRISLLSDDLGALHAAEAAAGPVPWIYLGSTYT